MAQSVAGPSVEQVLECAGLTDVRHIPVLVYRGKRRGVDVTVFIEETGSPDPDRRYAAWAAEVGGPVSRGEPTPDGAARGIQWSDFDS
jgi:hypothetical protein